MAPKRNARSAVKLKDPCEVARLHDLGATVNIDETRGTILSSYRSNVFKLLLDAKTISQGQHNAAYELIEDWAIWKGLAGSRGHAEKVDGGTGCADLITDAMINAGRRVAKTLAQVGPMDRELLKAFMVATVEEDRPMVWRGIVQRVTGIDQRDRQSTVVVMALENLRRVFEQPRGRVAA